MDDIKHYNDNVMYQTAGTFYAGKAPQNQLYPCFMNIHAYYTKRTWYPHGFISSVQSANDCNNRPSILYKTAWFP